MLEARSLTKRYNRTTALEDLTLRVVPGEVFCLVGANGAGKTTTLNLVLNFVEPTSGTVRIDGLDVTAHPLATKRHTA
jgi:ABC-2 type transport system ATP-binding protein